MNKASNFVEIFGRPDAFQISLAWQDDDAPASERPLNYGWSLGKLTLSVAGVELTAHAVNGHRQSELIWYLGPLFHWLADNWISLLHEENFPWPETSAEPAAKVYEDAVSRFASFGDSSSHWLRNIQAWYSRHAFSYAAAGGLFPAIFMRRFSDDIEISWSSAPPPFAPKGFIFETDPGVARLAVDDVAGPLWQMLQWVSQNPPKMEFDHFKNDWGILVEKIDRLQHITDEKFNSAAIAEALLTRVLQSFKSIHREDLVRPELAVSGVYVRAEAPAVAMFGGLSPNLSNGDITTLRDTLVNAAGGAPSDQLLALLHNAPLHMTPWQDGYELAADFLDQLIDDGVSFMSDGFVDVESICKHFSIEIVRRTLTLVREA